MFDAIDDGFCVIEMIFDEVGQPVDYRFIDLNPAFERQTGLGNALGRSVRELAPDHEQHWFDIYGRVATTGEPAHFENDAVALDRVFAVEACRIDAPELHHVALLFRDITDERRIESALYESEQRYRAFVNASEDAVYRMSADWSEMRQLDGQGFIADTSEPDTGWMERYILAEDKAMVDAAIEKAIRERAMFDLEHRVIRTDGSPGWTRSRAIPILDPGGEIVEWLGAATDVTAKRQMAEALRESEERQAFLLALSDELRSLSDPAAVQTTATALLARQLGVTRAVYTELRREDGSEYVVIEADHREIEVASIVGRYPSQLFESDLVQHRAGRPVAVADTELELSTETEKKTWRGLGARSYLSAPYIKDGRLVATFGVQHAQSRAWTDGDVVLVSETAERTWAAVERARAESALRESEERFREFGEYSSDVLWISDLDTMRLEYLSPAYERIWGEPRDTVLANYGHWRTTLHPDDAARAQNALPELMQGRPFIAEYRIVRPDGEVRWIRDTGFPIHQNGRVSRAGGIAQDVTALHLAQDRQSVLVAELQHRVRNILTVIRSVFQRTVEKTVDAREVADHFTGRLDAMARTQVLATRNAAGIVDLESLIRDELLSVGVHDGPEMSISGPDVALPFDMAEPIALAVHELTTNALKYGALQALGAKLDVRWEVNLNYGGQRQLDLYWIERGVPAVSVSPARKGFGRELIEEALPYRLGAKTDMKFSGNGVRCSISIPLPGEGDEVSL